MDTDKFRDVLQLIFEYLPYSKNYMLVCKFWRRTYKYTIATRPINIRCRNTKLLDGMSVNICWLTISYPDMNSINNLVNVQYLYLNYCTDIKSLPIFNNLKSLDISFSNIENILNLKYSANTLKCLNISGCKNINHFPKLNCLDTLFVGYTSTNIISVFNDISKTIVNTLKNLSINSDQYLDVLPNFTNLEYLCLYSVLNISNIEHIKSITCLRLTKIDNAIKIPQNIKNINVHYTNISNIENLIYVEDMYVDYSIVNNLPNFTRITTLFLKRTNIKEINFISDTLKYLYVDNSEELEKIVNFKNLEYLGIKNCNKIKSLPSFPNLLKLDIRHRREYIILPIFPKLRVLDMRFCENVVNMNINKNINIKQ